MASSLTGCNLMWKAYRDLTQGRRGRAPSELVPVVVT